MENIIPLENTKLRFNSYVYNLIALLVIYLVPTISHLLSFPLYIADPMRIMVMAAVIHTSNKNAFIIALTLPVFSFLLASHPYLIKALLITSELSLNVWLFFTLLKLLKNDFAIMFFSIILSKVYYYTAKIILIKVGLINTDLVSSPLLIQLFVALFIGGYFFFISKKKNEGTA